MFKETVWECARTFLSLALDSFSELRKATASFFVSVCPSGVLHAEVRVSAFMIKSNGIVFRMINVSDKIVDKTKTHIFSRKSCRLRYCGKYGKGRGAYIIRRMRFACWITKATDTYPEYILLNAFPRQHCLHERCSVLRYTYFACFFVNVIFICKINTNHM